jgi:polysaccharide deacetylase 2 family uncharacterized protein YibQ
MTSKKKRRKRKAGGIKPKGFFLVLFILLSGAAVIGLFTTLFPSKKPAQPLLYEETETIKTDLQKELIKIDHIIYDSLYQRGVSEQNILFLSVKPQRDGNRTWDFTELLIKIPDKRSALKLQQKIDDTLTRQKPGIKHILEKISLSESVFKIFTLGLYTHKIKLAWENHYSPGRDGLPRVAIIMDDLGYDPHMVAPFIHLDLPIAFSVLPMAPYSLPIAAEVRDKGQELILHLPMEPNNYPEVNPGPGALLTQMSDEEIRKVLGEHLKRIPGIRGVNNHMGSYFSTRKDKMAIVLRDLKRRNLFYIDSRTTPWTVADKMAHELGVPVASRSVFLDDDQTPKAIRFQVERLLGLARHSGMAIGIGHPYKQTLTILNGYLNKLNSEVRVVPVSDLVG